MSAHVLIAASPIVGICCISWCYSASAGGTFLTGRSAGRPLSREWTSGAWAPAPRGKDSLGVC